MTVLLRLAVAIAMMMSALAVAAASPAVEHFPVADNAPLSWNTGPYSYDAGGNVTAIGSQYFLYDTTSRLASAHIVSLNSAATQAYAYDVYGNMTSINGYGPEQILPADASTNHLSAATYDDAGNVLQWQPSGTSVVYKYDYDAAGMMTGLRTGPDDNPYTVKYIYTADDQRLWINDLSANDSHFTVRDLGGAVLSDFELKGTTWSLSRDYVYREGSMLASTSPSNALYYSLDHLGTQRLISDDQGYVTAFETFLPYGQELPPKALADGAVKKFTGHERDADPAGIGNPLDYMHARFYDGVPGRFLAVDPDLDQKLASSYPQAWNRYTYVRGNPLRYIDPDGRMQYDTTVLRQTVHVHIDDNLPMKTQKALQAQVDGAVKKINTGQNLTKGEISIIHNIKSIEVSGSARRSSIMEKTGALTLTRSDVERSSAPYLGSSIAHDGKHVDLFNQGGITLSRGLTAEVDAMKFQLQIGRKIGISSYEANYIQGLINNPQQLQSYVMSQP
jgi:RHS repeat-associated protein